MTIAGRIAIDATFNDTDSTSSVQSTKTISLVSSLSATSTNKVAVVSGTMTTAGTTLSASPTTYRDASGSTVSMTQVRFALFQASEDATLSDAGTTCKLRSRLGQPAYGAVTNGIGDSLTIARTSALTWSAGTASYTVVLYGE